jgi:nitrous oxidase accessory protein NosD
MNRIKLIILALFILFASTYALSECQEIRGENLSLTLDTNLDAQGQTCFYIEGINITFNCRNYLIYNASTAILVNNSHLINLYNCRIENSGNGIVLQVQTPVSYSDQYNIIIMRNTSASLINITITNTTNGILLNRTHQNTIRFANIRNSGNAISLFYSYANIIENSTFMNNQLGAFIYDAAPNDSQQNATPIPFKSLKGGKSTDPLPANDTVRGKYGSIIRHSIFQNNSIGIKLNQTANNSIYNNIFNNTQNVLSDSFSRNYINYWNSSYECVKSIINGACRGGNYWNDYYGYDDGSGLPPHDVYFDDVGDTLLPYIPNGEVSGDWLPLTKTLPPNWIGYCRNITQPGSYIQKRNIFGVISFSNHKCIEVLADDVVINCDGFNITDNTTYTDSYGVYISNYSNLTLANCTIQNYTTGLYERNSTSGALFRNNFSNDRYNIYFDVVTGYPSEISQFEKNITTDNYVYGRKVYYFVNGRTGDGYPYPAPLDAGFVGVIHGANILATGYDLYNNSPAMMFVNISSLEIKDNKVWKSGVGVYVLHSEDVDIKNNNLSLNSVFDIFGNSNEKTNISGNNFTNTGDGILIYNSNNTDISSNNAMNTGQFLSVFYSNYNDIHKNYLNYTNGSIKFVGCNYTSIHENEMWRDCGVGIGAGSSIRGIESNYTYIFLNTGSWRCESSERGFIYLFPSCLYGEIYNNTIKRYPDSVTWHYPINVNNGGYFLIHDNYIEDARYTSTSCGIQLPYCSGRRNVVYNNIVKNASNGIRAFYCQNDIFNNTVLFADRGLVLEYASGNYVFNNYVANSTVHAFDDLMRANVWNLPEGINCSRGPNIIGGPCWGGNYYGNYTGCDGNGDGIGESYYQISGAAQALDLFPLTNTPCKFQPRPVEEKKPVQTTPVEVKPLPSSEQKAEKKGSAERNSTSISVNSTQVSLPFYISIH